MTDRHLDAVERARLVVDEQIRDFSDTLACYGHDGLSAQST
jgi:hypothetical protein